MLKIWFQIWDQNIKINLSGEFQLIILSKGLDNATWLKNNESFFSDCAKQKQQ